EPGGTPPPPSLDDKTVRVLTAGLSAKDYATRLTATEALAALPASVAIPALERQLADPDEHVRAAAVLALRKHHDHVATALLQSVRDDEREQLSLRVIAATALLTSPCTWKEP